MEKETGRGRTDLELEVEHGGGHVVGSGVFWSLQVVRSVVLVVKKGGWDGTGFVVEGERGRAVGVSEPGEGEGWLGKCNKHVLVLIQLISILCLFSFPIFLIYSFIHPLSFLLSIIIHSFDTNSRRETSATPARASNMLHASTALALLDLEWMLITKYHSQPRPVEPGPWTDPKT